MVVKMYRTINIQTKLMQEEKIIVIDRGKELKKRYQSFYLANISL